MGKAGETKNTALGNRKAGARMARQPPGEIHKHRFQEEETKSNHQRKEVRQGKVPKRDTCLGRSSWNRSEGGGREKPEIY